MEQINKVSQEQEIISRKDARSLGLKRYYTGKLCKHGHLSERYSLNKNCVECERIRRRDREYNPEKERERNRKYYENNSEKVKKRHIKYREDNPEKYKKWQKRYYENNSEKVKKRHMKYREDNPEKYKKCQKRYRENNIGKIKKYSKEYNKKYREDNHEKIKEYRKKYYKDNLEKTKERNKKYREDNSEKFVMYVANRRAAKLQRTPPWVDLKAIFEFYKQCPDGYTVDHIIPLRGKLVSGLHVVENLQYLTMKENSKKNNKFKIL